MPLFFFLFLQIFISWFWLFIIKHVLHLIFICLFVHLKYNKTGNVNLTFFFAELHSVCVAGLFCVYGEVKSLQVSQVQHVTTSPFNCSIYLIVLVFSSLKWLQTVAYWRRRTLGQKWYLRCPSNISQESMQGPDLPSLNVLHFVSIFCQELFFMNLKTHVEIKYG